ncbi:hypothetical protein [Aquimarina megaterium]|uniref:hypothetical protein n=1 Tax=Aquimarina megaterium TaxID=1443666 RepID=UPI0004726177|nr:hypothetical protein [Aquimarina megaterium]
MKEHIKFISEIFINTVDIEMVNRYFEKNNISVKDRVLIIKKVVPVNTDQATDIVLQKYKGELSDELLENFLNNDRE